MISCYFRGMVSLHIINIYFFSNPFKSKEGDSNSIKRVPKGFSTKKHILSMQEIRAFRRPESCAPMPFQYPHWKLEISNCVWGLFIFFDFHGIIHIDIGGSWALYFHYNGKNNTQWPFCSLSCIGSLDQTVSEHRTMAFQQPLEGLDLKLVGGYPIIREDLIGLHLTHHQTFLDLSDPP